MTRKSDKKKLEEKSLKIKLLFSFRDEKVREMPHSSE
jgi:hypothetical protein